MTPEDLYADIGATPDMDEAELRKAYRRKAKETHPDAGGNPEAFHKAARALAILTDPKKREEYDRTGTVDEEADNALSNVLRILTSILIAAILDDTTGPDPTRKPLMPMMNEIVAQARTRLEENKAGLEANAKRLDSVLGRFVPRDKGNEEQVKNIGTVETLIRSNATINRRAILEVDRELKALDEAEKIIKNVGFEMVVDQPDAGAFWKDIEQQIAPYQTHVRPSPR